MPKRIQRKRTKGWRMPPGAVYVGRPTKWGNPYPPGKPIKINVKLNGEDLGEAAVTLTPSQSLQAYEGWAMDHVNGYIELYGDDWLAPLRGKDLACWCPLNRPCHADILLRLANE